MAAIRKNNAGKDVMVGGLVNWNLVRNSKKNVDFIRARIGSDGDFIDVYINNAADQTALKALFERIQKAKAEGRYMLIENVGLIQENQAITNDGRPVTNRRVSVGVTQVSLPKYKNSKTEDGTAETPTDQVVVPAPEVDASAAAVEAMTAKMDAIAAAMADLQQRLEQATAAQPVAAATPKKSRPRKAKAPAQEPAVVEAA